jgi:alkylation response protein AidB-like acyl-CoA dehydrogenase
MSIVLEEMGRALLCAPEGADLTAARGGDGWVLNGDAAFVLDGHVAGLVLGPARAMTGRKAR